MSRVELLQKLKAKRKEIADHEGCELFMVFSNKTLEETVKAMPATLADLALVKGWGKTKIAKYGTEMLDVLTNSKQSEVVVPISGVVFTVSEFLETANMTLSQLGTVRIQGEVSEMRHRGSVVYFTLKDTSGVEGTMKCVLWASKYEREYHYLEDGMEVVIDAWPEIYAKFGAFNVRVEKIEPVGAGALQKAFEALKKKLETKGYFSFERKRPLPYLIQSIGVITSEKGEAINDFLKNIGAFGFEITLRDVRVEGDRAEDSIVSAFREFNSARVRTDVLCLIRGGGGLENLQAFNTERVAEAVVSSRIPVLTGIGHERDVTIASLSSDADFSTPTKVADAIRRSREETLRAIEKESDVLILHMGDIVRETSRAYSILEEDMQQLPGRILERTRARVSVGAHHLEMALEKIFTAFRVLENAFINTAHKLRARMQKMEHTFSVGAQRMGEFIERRFRLGDKRVAVAEAALTPLDPISPLRRGYSIVYGKAGRVLKNTEDVTVGEHIEVRLYKGTLTSKVEHTS
ncbi:MAG: exodeoxyribonuclease VII large subunit [Candidatus Ryanbacteria bacterium RIFCSPHIGHO2_02_FULL_45_17b]|uniref:Exodeoxyribonuclease 7 large subunit n=1 Tax=Candidatus Ryanbacteria bacterium RIFCSPHIGHO2_01_FULL_45_22 TaxID=1802114 RepID=A0A1G2G3R8_9BACT|nr:MAG: exodeoxyribonuclease VII large subunit [Candidatus Ryanbacteria bacterium RIFCSPHIGHO2_01_FULL_45_22]OGZ47645.1 MAG: exodeoxyribonuclease VII large subunit [Candidatus Ryanbacteria bacterium RIFCSPHIGHO2_02_FULL_45_17b]